MGLTFHQPKEGFEEGDNTDDPGHNAREGTLGQMSQHIGSGQNNRFDVRIQELVSKGKNMQCVEYTKGILAKISHGFDLEVVPLSLGKK